MSGARRGSAAPPELPVEVAAAIDTGSRHIAEQLLAMSEEQRCALMPALVARLKAIGPSWWESRPSLQTLLVAGVACVPTAAQADAWLARRDFSWVQRDLVPLMVRLLREREVPWLADLATRHAARLRPTPRNIVDWPLVKTLVEKSGCPVPTSDGFVYAWAQGTANAWPKTLLEVWRADPWFDALAPRLFEVEGIGQFLAVHPARRRRGDFVPGTEGLEALATLAAEGRVGREVLLDGVLGRLLRGGRVAELRAFMQLHDTLAPTVAEMSARAARYVRLLASTLPGVASFAQAALVSLDEAEPLPVDLLAEATREVAGRAEKAIVRAQLIWVGKVLRRRPGDAEPVLVELGPVLRHPTLDLRDRVITLVATRGRDLSPAARAALAADGADLTGEMASQLAAALNGGVAPAAGGGPARVLGGVDPGGASGVVGPRAAGGPFGVVDPCGAGADGASGAIGPCAGGGPAGVVDPSRAGVMPWPAGACGPAPGPVPLPVVSAPPPIDSPAELAAEVARLLRGFDLDDPIGFERVLDGIVRMAFTDRAALRDCLADQATPSVPWLRHRQETYSVADHLLHLVAEVGAGVDVGGSSILRGLGWFGGRRARPGSLGYGRAAGPLRLLLVRVDEILLEACRHSVPGLLAAPTRASGHVDAAALVDRMVAYEAAGVTPWPWDLAQALLRVPERPDPGAIARAATLVSPAGQQVAAALASGRPALSLVAERLDVEPAERWHWRRPAVAIRTSDADDLVRALFNTGADPDGITTATALWPSVLPSHREVVAAHLLPGPKWTVDDTTRGLGRVALRLAECDGPPGPAMALMVAYALGSRDLTDRVAAVDAVMHLAATGALDTARVGGEIAELADGALVKLNRVVAALNDVVTAGAGRAAWEIAVAAIPSLVRAAKPAAGLADLIELATRSAPPDAAGHEVPGLAAVAARTTSSRLVTEARRLQRTLASART